MTIHAHSQRLGQGKVHLSDNQSTPLVAHPLTRMSHLLHATLKPGAQPGALRDACSSQQQHTWQQEAAL
jgi:hypothetical protein